MCPPKLMGCVMFAYLPSCLLALISLQPHTDGPHSSAMFTEGFLLQLNPLCLQCLYGMQAADFACHVADNALHAPGAAGTLAADTTGRCVQLWHGHVGDLHWPGGSMLHVARSESLLEIYLLYARSHTAPCLFGMEHGK